MSPEMFSMMQTVQDRFDDDHGSIDDQSEVQRAKAHQISTDTEGIHQDDGEQE